MTTARDTAREAAFGIAALEYRNERGLVILTANENHAHRTGFYQGYDAGHRATREEWVAVELGAEPHGPVWVQHGRWNEVSLAYFAHGIRKWYTRDSSDDLITDVNFYMPIIEPEPYEG